jgi:hypothetical protein
MSQATLGQQKSMELVIPVKSLAAAQRLVARVEAVNYALLRQRILSAVAVCSIVWLASLWLAAAIAQAQESPSNESSISVSQPSIAQPSIAATEPSHLVLSMVDRSERESNALQNAEIQPVIPQAAGQHKAILLPSDSRGSEYASLAALASYPSSSLLNTLQAKGAGPIDTGSRAGDSKPVVYKLGAVNLVINGLPDSFSVPSAGSGVAAAR